ncbi:hypothetical protein E8E13_008509 [Curvularia kusanoi]|uniref:Uncharacterized protein n=1 Tax=Curvularia kusanoi TaxID=90978 RepID=A0A9P4TPJ1_CURKU|nr:hypothetical protein E8E13_008509 [Curvularia kusanoi]
MFVTGILLAPAVMATPAVQDLANLRAVINAAAETIGSPQNPNRGWGLVGTVGQMGTADLINNITSTVLQSKFQIDTNKTAWLSPLNDNLNITNDTVPSLTLPMSSSMVLPTVLPTISPTSTPNPENVTSDLSTPYIDYVSSIPNLSTSLTSLGRVWHREMNAPVSQAIQVLQQSITTLQTSMIQNDLIGSSAVLRTIRASSSLESAQQAWSRFLNLPEDSEPGDLGGSDLGQSTPPIFGRSVQRLNVPNSRYYTHKELWGRKEHTDAGLPSQRDAVADWRERVEDRRAKSFQA